MRGCPRKSLMPVLLYPRRAQPRQTMLFNRGLPRQEFVNGQRIAVAGFLEAEQPAAHGGDDLGFAPDNPQLR
jgi:hypothetical protein